MDSFLDFLVHTKGWLRPEQAAAVPRHLTGPALDRHLIEQGLLRPGHVRRARLDQDAQLTFEVSSGPEPAADSGPANAPTVRSPRPAPKPEDATRATKAPPGQVIANVAIERVASRRARSVTYVGRLVESKKPAFLRDGALVDADETLLAAWLTAPLPEACSPTDRVANYFDKGRSGSGLWISREFVEGRPLAEVLAAGAFKQDQAERLAVDVLVGLAALHQIGSIHGRLHAGNVILSARSGRPRLVDHSLGEFVRLVEARDVVGGAVAPEVRGGADPSSRSDMWRFGVLLCEMLAGMVVPEGASATGRTDVATVVAEGLRKLEEGPFRDLVSACVSDDPTQRPFNGRAALQRVRVADSRAARSSDGNSGAPPAAEPAVVESAPAASGGRRWWVVAASVVVLAGMGTAVPIYLKSPSPVVAEGVQVKAPPCAKVDGEDAVLVLSFNDLELPVGCGKDACEKCNNARARIQGINKARALRKQMSEAKSADDLLAIAKQPDLPWIGPKLDLKVHTALEELKRSLVARWMSEAGRQAAEEDLKAMSAIAELGADWTAKGLGQLAEKVNGWNSGAQPIPKDGKDYGEVLGAYLPSDTKRQIEKWLAADIECQTSIVSLEQLAQKLSGLEAVGQAIAALNGVTKASWSGRKLAEEGHAKARAELGKKVEQELGKCVNGFKREVSSLGSPLDEKALPSSLSPTRLLQSIERGGSLLPNGEEWRKTLEQAEQSVKDWNQLQALARQQWNDLASCESLLGYYDCEVGSKIDTDRRRKALETQIPLVEPVPPGMFGSQEDLAQLKLRAEVLGQCRKLASALRALGYFGQLSKDGRSHLKGCWEAARDRDFGRMRDLLANFLHPEKLDRAALQAVGKDFAFRNILDDSRRGKDANDVGPLMRLVSRSTKSGDEFFYVEVNAAPHGKGPSPSLDMAHEWMIELMRPEVLTAAQKPEVFQPGDEAEQRRGLLCVWCSESLAHRRFLEVEAVADGGFVSRRIRRLSPAQ